MKVRNKRIRPLAASFAVVICLVVFYSNMAFANIFSGGHTSGFVTAYMSPSIANFGYTNMFLSAMCEWVTFSSKVGLFYSMDDNASYDKYFVENTDLTGLYGYMTPYRKFLWFYIVAEPTETWSYCKVTVYDNQMDNDGFSTDERISTITHEIGHSLSMAHPGYGHTTVMSTIRQSIGTTSYDGSELIRKWGP